MEGAGPLDASQTRQVQFARAHDPMREVSVTRGGAFSAMAKCTEYPAMASNTQRHIRWLPKAGGRFP